MSVFPRCVRAQRASSLRLSVSLIRTVVLCMDTPIYRSVHRDSRCVKGNLVDLREPGVSRETCSMAMEQQETPGVVLREARKAAGLSQKALAKRLGVSGQAVSRWELGEESIPPGRVSQVREVLGVDVPIEPRLVFSEAQRKVIIALAEERGYVGARACLAGDHYGGREVALVSIASELQLIEEVVRKIRGTGEGVCGLVEQHSGRGWPASECVQGVKEIFESLVRDLEVAAAVGSRIRENLRAMRAPGAPIEVDLNVGLIGTAIGSGAVTERSTPVGEDSGKEQIDKSVDELVDRAERRQRKRGAKRSRDR